MVIDGDIIKWIGRKFFLRRTTDYHLTDAVYLFTDIFGYKRSFLLEKVNFFFQLRQIITM